MLLCVCIATPVGYLIVLGLMIKDRCVQASDIVVVAIAIVFFVIGAVVLVNVDAIIMAKQYHCPTC